MVTDEKVIPDESQATKTMVEAGERLSEALEAFIWTLCDLDSPEAVKVGKTKLDEVRRLTIEADTCGACCSNLYPVGSAKYQYCMYTCYRGGGDCGGITGPASPIGV